MTDANNKLEVFTNDEFGSVRTVTIDGEPWFVGKDVAVALGYRDTVNALKKHVDDEDKIMGCQNATPSVTDDLGRIQYPIWINESGLYSLILSSKLPTAKKFKRWIMSEVIPSIRKHGIYMTDNLLGTVIDNPEVMCQVIEKLNADRLADKNKIIQLERELKTALPKAVYFDKFVDPGYSTNFRDTAKEFEMPQKCFINLLLEHNFIFRTAKNELRPSNKALENGLFILRDFTSMTNGHRGTYTLITAKGKKYIYEYFVKKGILK